MTDTSALVSSDRGETDEAAIGTYLELIYPAGWGWRGEISVTHSLPDGTGMPCMRTPRSDDTASVARVLAEFARGAALRDAPGVYLRCTTVRPDVAPGRRGGAGASVELPGLWADIDIAGPGHRHDPAKHGGRQLPGTVDAALGIVDAAGLPAPTAVVHSGGGLYAWWLFGQRVGLELEPAWPRISEAWQARLAAGAESMGLHYGAGVGNLDRVLGLVGTWNCKVPGDPRPRVLTDLGSGVRFEPGELAALVQSGTPGSVATPGGRVPGVAVNGGAMPSAPAPQGASGMPLIASSVQPTDRLSPLDDFELRHSWAEILIPKGWVLVKGDPASGPCEWQRPGASHQLSATTGRAADRDRMYVFSDAAGLPTGEPLTKGFVYAALWHGGDMSAAARAVQALGYGSVAQQQAGSSGETVTGRRLELTPASAMGGPRASRWLWEEVGAQWLPLGGLSLLGGREGVGKTTWTYRLIAQVTRGTLPGDLEGQPRSAVIAATEDSWEHTIIPRLMAAGADLDRVLRIDAVEPDRRTGVSLPEDLSALGLLLAEHPEVAMLVLDPIMTVLSRGLDSHKDHEVRRALEPISALAHGHGIAVIGLIHDNKSTGQDLSTRLMGSRAFVAVARAALVCTEELEEPEDGRHDAYGADAPAVCTATEPVPASETVPARTFLLGQVKSNLGPKVAWSIRYQIGAVKVAHDAELDKDVMGSHIVRIGRQTVGLDDIVREVERPGGQGRGAARRAAADALLDALRGAGERPSAAVRAELGEAGHAPATVIRALKSLGDRVTVRRAGRETYWSLTGPESGINHTEITGSRPRGSDSLILDSGSLIDPRITISDSNDDECEQIGQQQESGIRVITSQGRGSVISGVIDIGSGVPKGQTCGCPPSQHYPWCSAA